MSNIGDTINLNDVLPSYLIPLLNLDYAYWIPIVISCLFVILFLYICLQLLKIRIKLKEKRTFLEVVPTSYSTQSSFSTEQLFTILHSLEKPTSLLAGLIKIKQTVSCELVSTKEDGIRYILSVPSEDASVIKKSLLAYLPGIQIKEVKDYLPTNYETISSSKHISIKEVRLKKSYLYPLQEQSLLKEYDPISYITANMTKLEKDQMVILQIVSTPVLDNTHLSITMRVKNLQKLFLSNEDIHSILHDGLFSSVNSFILNLFGLSKYKRISEVGTYSQNLYKTIEDKITQPLFETSIRFTVISDNESDIQKRLKGLSASIDTFSTSFQKMKVQKTVLTFINKIAFFILKNRLMFLWSNPIVSIAELSSIYHFPYGDKAKAEDLIQIKSPKLPPPLSLKKTSNDLDIVFAHNTYGETTVPIGLTIEERRRHMYMIGATGTGKTTLLLQMIHKDIADGKGVAVLDPHGDLVDHILGVIPKDRIEDVVYFNPYDVEYPIGLNVMEMKEGLSESDLQREKDLVVSSIVSIFHKLYPARYSGPRMEHVLRNTVLTALELENPTLFTVYKLLTNKSYRKQVTANLKDQILKDFWKQEFGKMGSYQQAELISPITNKLGRFLTTTITRNILNQTKSKLDFEDIMNNKKILICDLSKGKIGEDTSSFLGSLVIAKLQLAALNRVHVPQEKRTDFFLYIDEFQNFATMTFAQILSEARKYRLNTILAHQTISQIEDKELLQVILANVGTIISFRTSNPSDERTILPLFTPQVNKNEIANLPSYNFYIKINALNPQDAFTGSTDNFEVKSNEELKQEVIENSRNKFGVKPEGITKAENIFNKHRPSRSTAKPSEEVKKLVTI